MGLPYGEEIMIVGRTMWTQSTSVTDRQTDGQNYDHKDRAMHSVARLKPDQTIKWNLLTKQFTNKLNTHYWYMVTCMRLRCSNYQSKVPLPGAPADSCQRVYHPASLMLMVLALQQPTLARQLSPHLQSTNPTLLLISTDSLLPVTLLPPPLLPLLSRRRWCFWFGQFVWLSIG